MHARFWIVCTYISLQNLRELWCGMWYVLTCCVMLALVFRWPFSVLCSHPRTHIHTIIESVHKSHKTMNEMNNFVESTQTHEHPKWRMCGICSVCYYFDVWRCMHTRAENFCARADAPAEVRACGRSSQSPGCLTLHLDHGTEGEGDNKTFPKISMFVVPGTYVITHFLFGNTIHI